MNSVKGHPKYGENSALYSVMGYVPASERSSDTIFFIKRAMP